MLEKHTGEDISSANDASTEIYVSAGFPQNWTAVKATHANTEQSALTLWAATSAFVNPASKVNIVRDVSTY